MRWIKEHRLLSTILSLLLVLIIIFVISVIRGAEGNGFTDILKSGETVLDKGFTGVKDTIHDNVVGIFSYRKLQGEVERLTKENNELNKKITEAKLNKEELEELRELSEILNFDYTKKKFRYVSADVISMDGSNWTNIFTIDRGEKAGIEVGDAVVNGMGLVGRVEEVGSNWAKVISIIDTDSKISFKLARDRKQQGIAMGDASGNISGFMMNADSTVAEGDVLITSGLGTYPEGLEIGNVKTVTYNSNTLLKEITIEASVNFKELDKVAVLK